MPSILSASQRCASMSAITPVPAPISKIVFGWASMETQAPNKTPSVPIFMAHLSWVTVNSLNMNVLLILVARLPLFQNPPALEVNPLNGNAFRLPILLFCLLFQGVQMQGWWFRLCRFVRRTVQFLLGLPYYNRRAGHLFLLLALPWFGRYAENIVSISHIVPRTFHLPGNKRKI